MDCAARLLWHEMRVLFASILVGALVAPASGPARADAPASEADTETGLKSYVHKFSLASAEQAVYVAKLDKAASTVCKDTTRAVKNTGYVSYAECLKKARLEISKKDPTGLYAASKTAKPVSLASK